jgi:hypothetical protein
VSYLYIYIFPVIFQDFVNVENHAYWQKLFRYELRLQETLGTISRSGRDGDWVVHIMDGVQGGGEKEKRRATGQEDAGKGWCFEIFRWAEK